MRNVLCFGDSNTWGYRADTHTRYDWGIRWTSILQKKLTDKEIRIIEEGLCGRTTVFEDELRIGRSGSKVLPILLEAHAPIDTVILMLGTNDCKTIYNASAAVIGKGIECLLTQIKRYAPDSKILLLSPIRLGERVWEDGFDPEFSERSVEVSLELPAVYREIARKHNIEYLAASDYAAPSPIDMEHLDAAGHKALADAVYHKLSAMLFS